MTALQRVKENVMYQCLYLRSHRSDNDGLEVFLTKGLQELFNVIAVASREELSQKRGAGRLRVGGADWEYGVLNLMSTTAYTTINFDVTEGVMWEVETALRFKNHEYIVFYFRPNFDSNNKNNELYESFVEKFSDLLESRPDPVLQGHGYLMFESNQKPVTFAIEGDVSSASWISFVMPILGNLSMLDKKINADRELISEAQDNQYEMLMSQGSFKLYPVF